MNPDLIERAEHTPDTVVTLTDGHKLVVEEPLDDVIALIRRWRASVAAEAITLVQMSEQDVPHTSRLPGPRSDLGQHSDHGEIQAAATADQSQRATPLGQVLHLPSREV